MSTMGVSSVGENWPAGRQDRDDNPDQLSAIIAASLSKSGKWQVS